MNLVKTIRGTDYCDSRMVGKKFRVQHAKVVRTIERLLAKMEGIRVPIGHPENRYKVIEEECDYQGQVFTAYKMNRAFFSLLAMRFENKTALEWQLKFIDQFDENERLRIVAKTNKENDLWFAEREATKIERRSLTDVVKHFVQYARECDSQGASFYYKAFTSLACKHLGILREDRDTLSAQKLNELAEVEDRISDMISECMSMQVAYKKIYQNVKKKLASANPREEAAPTS